MTAVRIALRVLRTDRRTRTSAVLTAVGVAVATGLMSLLVALPHAAQARADRAAWQQQSFTTGPGHPGTLSVAVGEDRYEGHSIVRVDVAALGDPARIELPPGIPQLPGPGEVLLSPELAHLAKHLPGAALGERYPGEVVGRLGEDALTHPGQLVALVGRAPSEMPPWARPQDGFSPPGTVIDESLSLLAWVGVVVLFVPSLVLVASAARLTAARRERRLAALRLAGATPGQVVAMVAAEIAIAAVGGALVGFAAGPLLRALAKYVPWDGGTWQAGDFALPLSVSVPLVVAIPVLVVCAAVLGLRRVVRAPLGAVGAHQPKRPHWWRLLSLPLAGALFVYVLGSDNVSAFWLLAALALIIASAALVGPWTTAAVGALAVRCWRRPSVLLAGRRLRHDPKGAYRASAGLVLAVFTGSMALTLLPSFEAMAGSDSPYRDSVLYVKTEAGNAERVAERADATLRRYGQRERATVVGHLVLHENDSDRSALVLDCEAAGALLRIDTAGACAAAPGVLSDRPLDLAGTTVTPADPDDGVPLPAGTPVHRIHADGRWLPAIVDPAVLPHALPNDWATVAVPSTLANRELVRTALVVASGGLQVESAPDRLADQQAQLADLRRVTVLGLVAAAVLSGCSAAIATAGSVLDRRRTFGSLIAAGTPVTVLARALRAEAVMPALVATIGAGAVGVGVGIGLFGVAGEGAAVLSPWIATPLVLGLVAALIAASVCRPALERVAEQPLTDE